MTWVHIDQLIGSATFERGSKTCRGCGRNFEGNVWTKPPIPRYRQEYVMGGRVLGWCGPCITAAEKRLHVMDAPLAPIITELRRPTRVPDNAGDAWEEHG